MGKTSTYDEWFFGAAIAPKVDESAHKGGDTMRQQKPQPLMLDGKPYYTLSSYEPVSLKVTISYVSDEDVDKALAQKVAGQGGTAHDCFNSQWIKAHFRGATSPAELRHGVRGELEQEAEAEAHDQAFNEAARLLAQRLLQEVPDDRIDEEAMALAERYYETRAGFSLRDLVESSPYSWDDIMPILRANAREVAECDAALDAYAREKHLRVTFDDISNYLGISLKDCAEMLAQARERGTYGTIRDATLRDKAGNYLLTQSKCEYHRQTRREAEAARLGRTGARKGRPRKQPKPPRLNLV